MKNPIASAFIVICVVFWIASAGSARPIDFGELSLLVRARESDASIMQEVSQRKLLYQLTPQQEKVLKTQGASDSLLQSLRNPNLAVSKEEAVALETKRQQAMSTKLVAPDRRETQTDSSEEKVSVFDVAIDHPVNLSQWGGPDYEFTFSSHRWLGENVVVPSMTNQSATYTHTAEYVGFGAAGWEFTPSHYFAIASHDARRAIQIDMQHPVWIKGVPYALYPIYGAGGVSLYYISATTYSVKLAVSTRWR